MNKISCRAKVSKDCLEGEPSVKQFGEDLPLTEDGTFKRGTIVCDPCYVVLLPYTPSGRGLNSELDAATVKVRQLIAPARAESVAAAAGVDTSEPEWWNK